MIILALLLTAQATPEITSEPLGRDRHRLRITGPIDSVEAAQAALKPAAQRLCGARSATFGTFRYSQDAKMEDVASSLPPVTLSLEQELFCGAHKSTIDAAALPAPDWRPTPADQQAVLAATYAYFAAKDRGHYADAWKMLSNSMKGISPAADWQREARDFNSRAGAVRARRVTEITWYNNPPDAPQPGLFVAADFSADFEKLDFVCGYVMWLLQPDGSFVLTREEQNLLAKPTAKKLASIDRAPLRAQMGCKD